MKKVVSNLILNKNLQILLLLRDKKPGIIYPGLWGFIGGSVEKKEVPTEAAIREIREETGLKMKRKNLKPFASIQTQEKKIYVFLIQGNWNKQNLTSGEGQELRFINMNKTEKLPMSPYHRYILSLLNDYLALLKSHRKTVA